MSVREVRPISATVGSAVIRRRFSDALVAYVVRVERFLRSGHATLFRHHPQSVRQLDIDRSEEDIRQGVVAMEAVLVRRRDQLIIYRTAAQSEEAWLTLRRAYVAAIARFDHVRTSLCLSVKHLLEDEGSLPLTSRVRLTAKQHRFLDGAQVRLTAKTRRYLELADAYFTTGVEPLAGTEPSVSHDSSSS